MPVVYTDTPESSAIARIGYDTLSERMIIVFADKPGYPEYVFGGVPPEFAGQFLLSPSKGKFYHNFLRRDDFYRVEPTLGSYNLGAVGKAVRRRVAKKVAQATIRRKVNRAKRR